LTVDESEALEASLSDDFRIRIAAGEALALHSGDEASTVLLRLLLDEMDTAVTQQTAEALVTRDDLLGATILFAGLALGDGEHGETILWQVKPAYETGRFAVQVHADEVIAGDNPWARLGARQALGWLGLGSKDVWGL
jgi:hypothetical protein